MPLILAIDSDKRQSTQLAALVRAQLQSELVQRGTVAEGLAALQGRVPDLVLTSSLMSPRDDAALATHLRELGHAAAHVQTVTIPLLSGASPARTKAGGMLAALRREKPQPVMIDGCAPDVFAEQIRQYLATAEEQKAAAAMHVPAEPLMAAASGSLFEASPMASWAPDTAVEAAFTASLPPAVTDGFDAAPAPPTAADALMAEPTHGMEPAAFEWPEAAAAPAVREPIFAAPVFEESVLAGPAVAESIELAPIATDGTASSLIPRATVDAEAPVDQWADLEPEADDPVAADTAADTATDEAVLVSEEPTGLPLSQLLQLVSDWQAPTVEDVVAAPAEAESESEPVLVADAAPEPPALLVEPVEDRQPIEPRERFASVGFEAGDDAGDEPLAPARAAEDEPTAAAPAALFDEPVLLASVPEVEIETHEEVELPAVTGTSATSGFGELYVDPMATEALEALSRQAPASSLGESIPAEAPVPIVEMQTFESLDSIASELAATGPARPFESLDDLASLFAATPAPRTAKSPAPAPAALDLASPTPLHGEKNLFESLFAEPAASARTPEPIVVPGIDPSLFAEPAVSTRPTAPPPLDVERVEIAPAPVVAPLAALGSVLDTASALEPEPEPELSFALLFEPVSQPVPEPVPVATVAPVAPIVGVKAQPAPMPAADALVTRAPIEEEISLDIDAFEMPPIAPVSTANLPAASAVGAPPMAAAPVAPPEPVQATPDSAPDPTEADSRFSFTFVETFGDAWSEFDVPTVASVAEDLGLAAQAPSDLPGVTASAATPAAAPAAPAGAPMLDDEALSLIGDAALKASLDAFVIEEFERGIPPRKPAKKIKAKRPHVGATQVAPAPERPDPKKKRPVQDEWGMFDPEQCGFAALEDEEAEEPRPPRAGTRVRVISY